MNENQMNNICEKVRYLIKESGYSLTEFADKANRNGYPLTRQTLSTIINDKNPYPTVQILNSIVQVCHKLGNEKLKKVTFDFLLNDDITDLEAINASLHYELGLSEESIKELKFESYPFVDHSKEIDYFIHNSRYHYWQNLARIRIINDVLQYQKDYKKYDILKIKEKLNPLISDNEIFFYLDQFHNEFINEIKKFVKKIDSLTEDEAKKEFKDICSRLDDINNSFKYEVMEMTRHMIEIR